MSYTLEEVQAAIAEKVTGKIVPRHTIDKHVYEFVATGRRVDSVTQKNILDKPHLIPWAVGLAIDFLEKDNRFEQLKGPTRESLLMTAKFVHRDTRDEAGTLGGQAHAVIETWLKEWIRTGIRPIDDIRAFLAIKGTQDHRVWAAARSAEAAFNKYKVEPVAVEIIVGIDGEGAGTLDLMVLTDEGELELWDWKSSNQVNDFYAMQVAAYRRYFMHMTGLKVGKVRIFKIDKAMDRFHSYLVPFPNEAAAAFRGLSKAYDWLANSKDKLVEDKKRITI